MLGVLPAATAGLQRPAQARDVRVHAVVRATRRVLTPDAVDEFAIANGRDAFHMVAWLVSKENSFTTASVFDLSGGRATY